MLAQGRASEMLDTLFDRYEAYAHGQQLVLIEGTHEDGPIGASHFVASQPPAADILHAAPRIIRHRLEMAI